MEFSNSIGKQSSAYIDSNFQIFFYESVAKLEGLTQIAWTWWATSEEIWAVPNGKSVGEGWHVSTRACPSLENILDKKMVAMTESSWFGRAYGARGIGQKEIEIYQVSVRPELAEMLKDYQNWFN